MLCWVDTWKYGLWWLQITWGKNPSRLWSLIRTESSSGKGQEIESVSHSVINERSSSETDWNERSTKMDLVAICPAATPLVFPVLSRVHQSIRNCHLFAFLYPFVSHTDYVLMCEDENKSRDIPLNWKLRTVYTAMQPI